MKKVLVFILCATLAFGSVTPTSHIGLSKVTPGTETGTWGPIINANYDLIDSYLAGVLPLPILSFFNGVTYVGEGSKFAGDIGAQLNAAYVALSAPGGTIAIVPKADGSCYDFSTQVSMSTQGKYPLVKWIGASGMLGVTGYQNCLNYTPTSGTAFTLDYATATGEPVSAANGLENIFLVNNKCSTFGGCGGTAIGIDSGTVNAGSSVTVFKGVALAGFATGFRDLGTSLHCCMYFDNVQAFNNGTGFLLNNSNPNTFSGGTFAGNTAVFKTNATTSSPGIVGFGMDFFNNTAVVDATTSVSPAIGTFYCNTCHFEASTSAQAPFVSGAIDIVLMGGVAEIDTAGGTVSSFFNLTGNVVDLRGVEFLSSATTTNILVAGALTKGNLDGYIFGSTLAAATYVSGAGAANVNQNLIGVGALADIPTYFKSLTTPTLDITTGSGLRVLEGGAPSAVSGKEVCYADSATHALKCSYNNDAFLGIPRVVASGTSTLGNSSIAATTCNSAVTTVATGVLTTDTITWSYATAPSGTTDGKLILNPYPTSGNVNFVLCNPTAGALVPTGLVVNWKVTR